MACQEVTSFISVAICLGLACIWEPSKSRMMTRLSDVTRILPLCKSPCTMPAS